jgi:lysozyme
MITGIDVSHWQGEIDWAAVASAGIRFVFMKATEGATYTDPSYERNRAEARRLGIASGAYHYFRATSEVHAQVENFLRVTGEPRIGDLPAVLDAEDPGQWKGKSREELTALVVQWLDLVEEANGLRPLIYLSPNFAETMLDSASAKLAKSALWIAHWTDTQPRVPKPWTGWTFWQYSSKGQVAGITANVVDLDRFAGSEAELHQLTFGALGR